MSLPGLLALIPALFGLTTAQHAADDAVVRRLVVQDELILRVPVRRRILPPFEWRERKGPKCLPADSIAGAYLSGKSSIDFVLRDRSRVRAEMGSDCPALDFYGGFYVEPEKGKVCARREEIRSRMGGSCRIERFRALVPTLKR